MPPEDHDPLNPSDPLAALVAEIDQYQEDIKRLAPAMAAEYKALVDEDVPSLAAAVLVGTRWKIGS